MDNNWIIEKVKEKGFSYYNYLKQTEVKLNNEEFKHNEKYDLTKLNFQRSNRIYKTYKVSDELKHLVETITNPQIWMVLTEDWCGDSAQNLPYIAKIAELNELINLKILLRDQNLDVMDLYLTNGKSRSIPKLVAFDQFGDELFLWGPRPKEAQLVVEQSIKDGLDKNDYLNKLHSWYTKNKGRTLESEFMMLIQNVL